MSDSEIEAAAEAIDRLRARRIYFQIQFWLMAPMTFLSGFGFADSMGNLWTKGYAGNEIGYAAFGFTMMLFGLVFSVFLRREIKTMKYAVSHLQAMLERPWNHIAVEHHYDQASAALRKR